MALMTLSCPSYMLTQAFQHPSGMPFGDFLLFFKPVLIHKDEKQQQQLFFWLKHG